MNVTIGSGTLSFFLNVASKLISQFYIDDGN